MGRRKGTPEQILRSRIIRAFMALHDISARAEAKRLGVSREAVQGVIGGYFRSYRVEQHLARLLNVPAEVLFGPRMSLPRGRSVVNAEESTCDRPEDDLERARRLVG